MAQTEVKTKKDTVEVVRNLIRPGSAALVWNGIIITVELITPDIATEMLKRNLKNRSQNEANLAFIKKHMLAGDFPFTGDTIKIGDKNRLLDGQHRLISCVETGLSFWSIVVRGIPEDRFSYMDINRVRTMADVLSIVGVTNAAQVSSMVRFIINYKDAGMLATKHGRSRQGGKVSNEEGKRFVEKHGSSVVKSYGFGFNKDNNIFPPARLAGLHYLLKEKNADAADEFCRRLADGLSLKADSPIYQLRQILISDQKERRKMSITEKIAFLIKAWNLFVTKKTTTKLTWNSSKEGYPKIV